MPVGGTWLHHPRRRAAASGLLAAILAGAGLAACASHGIARAGVIPPTAAAAGAGLETAWPAAACLAAREDADLDGLDDACELDLARAFAPVLVLEEGACGWDDAADPPRPAGGWLFGVQRAGGEKIRIAYLPAYRQDCGWSGPKCVLVFWTCPGHPGDSELVALQVAAVDERVWATEAVFLSAHCFGDRSCRWYAGRELARFEWADGRAGGAPVVWTARGSNANYPSRAACDRGHHFLDTCDRNARRVRFPVVTSAQNIGSRARPFLGRTASDCVTLAELPWGGEGAGAEVRECFWSDEPFRGWTGAARDGGPTPYAAYLGRVLGF